MNLRSLALILPLTFASAGCSQAPTESIGSGAAAQTTGTTTAGLHNVEVAVYDLKVTGRFPACASSFPEVAETHLVHPRRLSSGTLPGKLSIVVADPNDLQACHLITSHEMSFRVRLDARSATASNPDAIHQLSPRMDSDYEVIVNDERIGVVSVGLPYLMAFDPVK